MLAFRYIFLILGLSSSVISVSPPQPPPPQSPPPPPQSPPPPPHGEREFLLHNPNVRLSYNRWARVIIAPSGGLPATWARVWRRFPAKWAKVLSLDDVIYFGDGTSGVENVELFRVKRTWTAEERRKKGTKREDKEALKRNTYRVSRRSQIRPAEIDSLLGPLHIDERCRLYLDDTYWGRNWKILGKLYSGPNDHLGDVIHIKWMEIPETNVEVPYVTFTSENQLKLEGKMVLRAKDHYVLNVNKAVMKTLKNGYVRPEGFVSQICHARSCKEGQIV